MKLRNRKTGEIANLESKGLLKSDNNNHIIVYPDGTLKYYAYNSLAELNEEWEDYEEPKEYWFINDLDGTPMKCELRSNIRDFVEWIKKRKQIGNYFETKEEAEKAVEKLKAWKRLKDDGLKIRKYELNGGTDRNGCFTGDICITLDISKPVYEDILQLLFGGEE